MTGPAQTSDVEEARPNQEILTAAKGTGITFVGTLLEYAGRFLLGLLLARLLGPAGYGLYSLADSAFFMVVGIALLGLDNTLLHFVPIDRHQKDDAALRRTLQIGLGFPTLVGLVGGIGLWVYAAPLADVVFRQVQLTPFLKIVAIATPFGTLAAAAVAVTRGFKKMQYKVIAQDIVLTGIKLLLTLIFALMGLTVAKALWAYALATIAACILLLYYVNRLFPLLELRGSVSGALWRILAFSLPVYLSRLLAIFGPNLRTIFLGMFSTAASVGIFTAALRIRMLGLAFQQTIVVMSSPIVSDLYHRKALAGLSRFYKTMTKWALTFNFPVFLIIILFPNALLSIFGSNYMSGALALIILALGDVVNAGTGICGVMVMMTGNPWLNTINSLVALFVNIGLSIWLIPSMGLLGASIAACASVVVSNLSQLLEVLVLFRFLPYDRSFYKPIMSGLIASGIAYGLARWGNYGLFIQFACMVLLLGFYVGGILALGLSTEDQLVLARLATRFEQHPILARLLPRLGVRRK